MWARVGLLVAACASRYEHGVAAEYLTSAVLDAAGFRHAFFTRHGGVSEGPYATLNFSRAVGDTAERVAGNVGLAAAALGVPATRVYYLSQVHGTVTHVLDGTETPAAVINLEGDALVSGVPGVACGVRSADCVPILVGERTSGAVAAIHAGWRGVVRGVVEAAVGVLREQAGRRGELVAAIGPHIRVGAFEVSADVAQELALSSPVAGVVEAGNAKPHVALVRIVRGKLEALGLAPGAIDDVGGCTVTEPERFFSFRRDGKVGGRHLSAIVPRAV
jgi:purine-nucleoside/S-methyl-5'-thioadenosine phosphorylase / adenosine deaminase